MSKFNKKEIAEIVGLHLFALIAIGLAVYLYREENRFPSAEEARIQAEEAIQKTEKRRQAYCSGKHIVFVQRVLTALIAMQKLRTSCNN